MEVLIEATRLPEDDTRLPEDDTRLPEDDTRLPEDDTRLPEDDTRLPEDHAQGRHGQRHLDSLNDETNDETLNSIICDRLHRHRNFRFRCCGFTFPAANADHSRVD